MMKYILTCITLLASLLVVTLCVAPAAMAKDCGGVKTAIIDNCPSGGGKNIEDSAVWYLLVLALNIVAGIVGIVAIGGLVYGAILYASAQDNASQVQEAIGIIRNVVIGLVLFAGMYLLLQYLIPGGIFATPAP